ncbi:hypothetical protein AB0C93_09495 [Streptomyces sp. NPDC048518]|uniref:hypothetical protein n=1 Tax=Streptomyces sp. NPDC048518 TaxID=3155029 RepID=UPI003409C5E4
MAWNEIPAKGDPNLSFQAYYARPNIIQSILEPVSSTIFRQIWSNAEDSNSVGLQRAALVGLTMADLIRAIGMEEVCESEIKVGDWFTHSGITQYHGRDERSDNATIKLPDNSTISAIARHECRITNSASGNMIEADDVSFVVGRRISESKFDLVAAGFRDAIFGRGRDLDLTPVYDLSRMRNGDPPWSSHLAHLKFNKPDREALVDAIEDTVTRFAMAVGQQGAWKLLYGRDGKPLHESQHQGMFRLFSQLPFGALRINMEPNADHGSGPTDFTLRLNEATNVVEFKKDDRREEIRHGLAVQLPNYMTSAGADRGTYVVMCHSRTKEEVYQILNEVIDADQTLPQIDCYVIDCSRKVSASKAASRYSLD